MLRRTIVAALILLGAATAAQAADKLRVGKTIGVLWSLTPVDVGLEEGIFAKYGLDVEITTLTGDPKLMAAFVADSLDVGLGGGTGMVFALKGAPVLGIAALAGAPRNFSIIVGADSPLRSAKELKGKALGVASTGALTEWFDKSVAVAEGWGKDGIRSITTGGFEATVALLKTHQIDGFIGATELGYQLEERGQGRILVGMETYIPRFETQILTAREPFIRSNPDLVARFVKGIFASVTFMKANREKTIAITSRVLNMTPTVIAKTYDYEIAMLSDDGVFDPAAVKVLKDSYVDMGLLTEQPKNEALFTTQFVPAKL